MVEKVSLRNPAMTLSSTKIESIIFHHQAGARNILCRLPRKVDRKNPNSKKEQTFHSKVLLQKRSSAHSSKNLLKKGGGCERNWCRATRCVTVRSLVSFRFSVLKMAECLIRSSMTGKWLNVASELLFFSRVFKCCNNFSERERRELQTDPRCVITGSPK